MTRDHAKLILSRMLIKDAENAEQEREEKEAVATLACGALDDLSSVARSLEKLAIEAEVYRKGIRS